MRKASLARPRSRELFMPHGMRPSFPMPAGRSRDSSFHWFRRCPSGLPTLDAGSNDQRDEEQNIKSDDTEQQNVLRFVHVLTDARDEWLLPIRASVILFQTTSTSRVAVMRRTVASNCSVSNGLSRNSSAPLAKQARSISAVAAELNTNTLESG